MECFIRKICQNSIKPIHFHGCINTKSVIPMHDILLLTCCWEMMLHSHFSYFIAVSFVVCPGLIIVALWYCDCLVSFDDTSFILIDFTAVVFPKKSENGLSLIITFLRRSFFEQWRSLFLWNLQGFHFV